MIILGIETSCDETAIAVLEIKKGKIKILGNFVSSQVKLHAKYGGVYPFLAKREHQRNLFPTFIKALKRARLLNSKFKIQNSKLHLENKNLNKNLIKKIDFIAVTIGPGLEPCLWQGINFAQDLAKKIEKPLIPINHIEAHLLANWLKPVSGNFQFFHPPQILRNKIWAGKILNFRKILPAVCLVVSGGHTQLILMKKIGEYKLIGETRDDAAGECFDKTARILGLGYPGGPAIAAEAARFKVQSSKLKVKLPRPMLGQKNYDFSFSGLKTAVLYDFQNRSEKERKSKEYLQAMAAEVQQAIIDVLIYKTTRAAKEYKAKSIILGGGVTANNELRKQFKSACLICHLKHFAPPAKFCTDNAVMIALTGFFHKEKAVKDWQKIKANANLNIGRKFQ